jgi:uncharacterized membrane protein YfcA
MGNNNHGDNVKYKRILYMSLGLLVGLVNSLLGAGGGMIAVPLLKKCGLDTKKAHANAVAVILPITVFSASVYMIKDYVNIKDAFIFMPFGIAGSVLATWLLKKISPNLLRIVFGGFMIWAGVRMLFK